MNQVDIIAIDLAKNVFQPHGATRTGDVVFRLKLTRARLVDYVASIPPCTVAMEACAGAHHWGRKFQSRQTSKHPVWPSRSGIFWSGSVPRRSTLYVATSQNTVSSQPMGPKIFLACVQYWKAENPVCLNLFENSVN